MLAEMDPVEDAVEDPVEDPEEEDPEEEDPGEEDPEEEAPGEEDPEEEDPEEIEPMDIAEFDPTRAEMERADRLIAEAHAEEPTDDAIGYTDVHMYPLPAVRAPTPPPPPLSPSDDEDSYEELTPTAFVMEDAPDPDTPPPSPVDGVPRFIHDWVVGTVTAELTEAEIRLDESRRQLAAEREARYAQHGGMRFTTPHAARREMTRIEMRARIQIRSLPIGDDGRVSRADTEEIVRAAMARVRDMTRPAD